MKTLRSKIRSRRSRSSRHSRRSRTFRKKQSGGTLQCTHQNNAGNRIPPKCGQEGCVYFDEDRVTKIIITPDMQRIAHLERRRDDQNKAHKLGIAPQCIEFTSKICPKINIEGQDAPCYVKRGVELSGSKKISYIEQKNKSWCRGYRSRSGKEMSGYLEDHACEVPKESYDKMIQEFGKNRVMVQEYHNVMPNVNMIANENNSNGSNSEYNRTDDNTIKHQFLYSGNMFIIKIVSERINGITIDELYEYIISKGKVDMVKKIGPLWQEEIVRIMRILDSSKISLSDVHSGNVMIDVGDSTLCNFIMDHIDRDVPITPDIIREQFGKQNILKIVDWGI
jgi:hypothetical protein